MFRLSLASVAELHKAFRLNTLPLDRGKRRALFVLSDLVLRGANTSLGVLRRESPRKRTVFHHLVYDELREAGLPSQVACDVVSQVWEGRKTAQTFHSVPIRFNLPRAGALGETRKGNPVVSVCVGAKHRLALPIAMDGACERLAFHIAGGFVPKQVRLCLRKGELRLWVLTEKEVPDVPVRPGQPVVGVDVGVRSLAAVSVVSDRVLEQHYLGRDLYAAQRDAGLRRSILQEGISTGAMKDRSRRGMRRMRGWENRFTTTRSWQVAHQVVALAEKHGAAIAIEDLKDLNENTRPKSTKKGRRKTHRLPYSKFRSSLESLALERGVPLVAVPPAYTSRRCSRCGEMGNRKGATFRCPGCGYLGNADRNASVNIARIASGAGADTGVSNQSSAQDSRGGGRVNGPVGNEDGGVGVGWQPYHSPEFKPPVSTGGR